MGIDCEEGEWETTEEEEEEWEEEEEEESEPFSPELGCAIAICVHLSVCEQEVKIRTVPSS